MSICKWKQFLEAGKVGLAASGSSWPRWELALEGKVFRLPGRRLRWVTGARLRPGRNRHSRVRRLVQRPHTALTATRLNTAVMDEALAALRALTEHRDDLVQARTQTVNLTRAGHRTAAPIPQTGEGQLRRADAQEGLPTRRVGQRHPQGPARPGRTRRTNRHRCGRPCRSTSTRHGRRDLAQHDQSTHPRIPDRLRPLTGFGTTRLGKTSFHTGTRVLASQAITEVLPVMTEVLPLGLANRQRCCPRQRGSLVGSLNQRSVLFEQDEEIGQVQVPAAAVLVPQPVRQLGCGHLQYRYHRAASSRDRCLRPTTVSPSTPD